MKGNFLFFEEFNSTWSYPVLISELVFGVFINMLPQGVISRQGSTFLF